MDFGQTVDMSQKVPEKTENREYKGDDNTLELGIRPSFLSSFLAKNLKTTQLVVNTDEKTLRPVARLKEPRDLFALPKDKDNDCSQQAPRWPIECQVLEERIYHIPYVPGTPEPLNQPTGNELKPRPVGEENGVVVFNYNPISAVNYDDNSSDSDTETGLVDYHLPNEDPIECLMNSASSSSEGDSDQTENKEKVQESNKITESPNENKPQAQKSQVQRPKRILPRAIRRLRQEVDKDKVDTIWKNPYNETGSDNSGVSNLSVHQPIILSASQLSRLEQVARKSYVDRKSSDHTVKEKSKLNSKNSSSSSSSSSSSLSESESESSDSSDGGNEGGLSSSDENDEVLPTERISSTTSSSPQSETSNILQETMKILVKDGNIRIDDKEEVNILLPPPRTVGGNSVETSSDLTKSLSSNSKFNKKSYIHKQFMLPQFSRSAVGGAKFVSNCHPYDPQNYEGLEFESRFESGNLAKAVQITRTYYELYLRPDLYTSRSRQWFYFRVKRTRKNLVYRFSIVNLVKSDSLYNEGMRPVMYSTIDAKEHNIGWRRCGDNIAYYRNEDDNSTEDEDDNCSYSLTFNIEFRNDNDTVYFAHCYPYTYSDLQDYLMEIQNNPVKSQFCKLRLLCRTLAGNNVYYLTVTAPSTNEETIRKKKAIVVSARVHPSETPASWMMKGLMDFLTGDSTVAKRLRHRFIFKLIPMLNPDGVIVGNTRNSLAGKDLNRQYRTVIRETYPSIWYTKALIKRLIDECGVAMYCDMHAHSRKHNIFIYGCENRRNPEKRLTEQVFPLMLHKNVADKFSFESCKFKIQRSKEGTGRIVVWMLGITNSYTIEASFGGSTLGSRKGTHFNVADYEHMGRSFCETLLDYYDDHPNKVKKTDKLFKQIKKLRKREKREQKALKLKKMAEQERLRLKIIERLLKEGSSADEPLNIPLSDYSSDEGNCSSSSDNEGKGSITVSDLEGPCCAPLKAPPCTPEIDMEVRKFRYRRMKKIMQQLDKLYFQPVLHKKFQTLFKGSVIKQKSYRMVRKPKKKSSKKEFESLIETNQIQPNTLKSPESVPSTPAQIPAAKSKIVIRPIPITISNNSKQQQLSQQQTAPQVFKGQNLILMKSLCSQNSCSKKSSVISQRASETISVSNSLTVTSTADTSTTSNEVSRDPKQLAKKKIIKKRKRIKIARSFRLWLLARNIVIFRKEKRRKRHIRRKKGFVKKTADRLPLDMPTTDPGSDIHFSSDEEFQFPRPRALKHGMARIRNAILQQSDLIKRCMDGNLDTGAQIPPELIITSPIREKHDPYALKPPNTTQNRLNIHAPPSVLITPKFEADSYGNLHQRTNSWHSLSSSSTKINKMRSVIQGDDVIKLSLRKKIWPSGSNEGTSLSASNSEANKSLSWYQPRTTSSNALAVSSKDKSASSTHTKTLKKIDINASLLNECSQKLLLWQQQEKMDEILNSVEKKIPGPKGDSKPRTNCTKLVPPSKSRTNAEECLKRFLHAKSESYARQKHAIMQHQHQLQQQGENGTIKTESSKSKKMVNLSKVTETTQIVQRLVKSKNNKSTSGPNGSKSNISLQAATSSNIQSQKSHSSNKFKTGGIVVTAVQPSEKKSRKQKTLSLGTNQSQSATINQGANNTSLHSKEKHQQSANTPLNIPQVVDSKTMLKTIKKKKITKPKIIDLSEITREPTTIPSSKGKHKAVLPGSEFLQQQSQRDSPHNADFFSNNVVDDDTLN